MRLRGAPLVALAACVAAIPAATQARASRIPPGPTGLAIGLVSSSDAVGLGRAAVPAAAQRAFAALLAPGRPNATGVMHGRRLAVVSRVAQARGSAEASRFATTLSRLPARRQSQLDSAAAARIAVGPGRAHAVWSGGSWVGEVSVLGAGRRGPALARALADTVRTRVLRTLDESAWSRVLDEVHPDGTVDVQTALQAFALAIAPVPGVRLPRGPRRAIPDGTLAVDLVLSKLGQLAPAQQTAVTQALARSRGPRKQSARVPAGSARSQSYWLPNANYQADATHWADLIGKKLGIPLTLQIHAGTTTSAGPGGDADAFAQITNAQQKNDKGPATDCWISVTPTGEARDVDYLELVLAHEAFHCFQGQLGGILGYKLPPWILEGGANWAACNVAPAPHDWDGAFTAYLGTPGASLFGRTYDAEGFFSLLSQHGVDLWHRWPAIIADAKLANGSKLAFQHAVGAEQETILWDWAASYKQLDEPSTDWNVSDACRPIDIVPAAAELPLANGSTVEIAAPRWGAALLQPVSTADIIRIVPDRGHIRLSSVNPTLDRRVTGAAEFCTAADSDCTCPGSPKPALPHLDGSTTVIALTGGSTGAAGIVTGISLFDYCKPTLSPGACFASIGSIKSILGLTHAQLQQMSHQNDQADSTTCGVGAWNGAQPGSTPAALQAARSGNAAAFGGVTWVPGSSPANWESIGFAALVAGIKTHSVPFVPLPGVTGPIVGKPYAPAKTFGVDATAWLMPSVPAPGIESASACWWDPKHYRVICLGLEEQAGKPIAQHLDELAAIAVPQFLR